MIDNPTWTQHYDVNTMVLDHQKRISLVGVLNLLQDTAWIHADHLGWGYEALVEKGTIWVLSRQKLVLREWPLWRDLPLPPQRVDQMFDDILFRFTGDSAMIYSLSRRNGSAR